MCRQLVIEMLSEPPRREKLRHVNTLSDVVRLIRGAGHVIVLTGAGVSPEPGPHRTRRRSVPALFATVRAAPGPFCAVKSASSGAGGFGGTDFTEEKAVVEQGQGAAAGGQG